MARIVEYPAVVQEAMQVFGDLFANEPQRQHFAEYLSGLIVAERKNVSAISREFIDPTDQSCLNRWLNEVSWDVSLLNERRLAFMQRDPKTRYSPRGVIAIDNTLIDHEGKLIEDAGWFWDHAEERYKIAHDLVISNYVCTSGAHYPLDWRRFRKEESCPKEEFRKHPTLCIELVEDCIRRDILGDFTFDSYFCCADVLNHIQKKDRSYVGGLKLNRKLIYFGREQKLQEVASQIPSEAKKPIQIGERTYYYFTRQVRIPEVNHPVRIVLFFKERTDQQASKALVTNRLGWEPVRILLVYRHRWTGTETFHRDAKQELGLGECQVRKGEGQTRHVHLVHVAYSLLMRSLHQKRTAEWAREKLTTIGQACRAVRAETLGQLLDWALDMAERKHWSRTQIKAALQLP